MELVKITQNITSKTKFEDKYPGIYKGIGKLKSKTVKLHINPNVKPVAQRNRRTPFHLRAKVEKEIKTLLENDIIEEVKNEPTPWVSPIVTPPKQNGDVRLCVDMREANKAIERERHQMPTIDELIHDMNGAKVFSKLDLTAGYNQLVLQEESRYITTFATHMGLYRYKRLNFGTNSASEVFQKTISEVIQGIGGSKNISDDIIVYAKNQSDHDIALDKVFRAIHKSGMTLNKSKCEFNKTEITFFGVVFGQDGISPSNQKVEAVKQMPEPTNVTEMRSFLGMTSYSSRFIQNYATISEPLRRLTRNDTQWEWGIEQQTAFDQLKSELSSETVMAYFNPSKDIELITDGSPVGISGILTQEGRVVAYASRSLTQVEMRYSQTEREALALVWSCEHFAMYLKGAPTFTCITDCMPLTRIWEKKQPPLRIERWGLRLQPFKMKIEYRSGKDNPSDFMSRHPLKHMEERNLAEEYVSFVTEQSVPNAMTIDEVKMESLKDKTMQKAVEYSKTGKWYELKTLNDPEIDKEELLSLRSIKDELTVYNETLLMKNDKLVIPKSLREKAIKLGHEGHQGIVKIKSYIRSKVYFPNMNSEIESAIQKCLACQSNSNEPRPREPLRMSELPSGPWLNISADFCGPLENGDYLLVLIDEYSRYPIVEIVRSTSANTVIPVLDKIVSMFAIPKVIKTDNGSPFQSKAFADFMKFYGIIHRKITPRWARANSQAESFNKPLMKSVKSSLIEARNYKQGLYDFLRQYRATPHVSTGYTPFKLMFGRDPTTRMPNIGHEKNGNPQMREIAQQNDDLSKMRAKRYEDERINAKDRSINVGDRVLVRNESKTKSDSTYKPTPYTVFDRKGTMISVRNDAGHTMTRNSSVMKTVDPGIVGKEQEICENDLDEGETTENEQNLHESPQSGLARSRPTRDRRPPSYLKDYVPR